MNQATHKLAFVHTDKVHIANFQKLTENLCPGVSVRHEVHADLLEAAQKDGVTPELREAVNLAMCNAADSGASVVICTCSSIAGMAEQTPSGDKFVVTRIDRAMADKAVRSADKILVLAALRSTLEPTRELLEDSAQRNNVSPVIDIQTVDGAWPFFESGDTQNYAATIERHIRQACQGYGAVVLAQASMAPAEALCADLPIEVLSSPKLGVLYATELLGD